MGSRALTIAAAVALGGAALGSTAVARASDGANDGPAPVAREAEGAASARAARVAAFVLPGGRLARGKNVSRVTHPSTGLYCVDPSTSIDVLRVVPSITVDWSSSRGDGLLAQYRSSGIGCPVDSIAVLTFSGDDGSFDLSDDVGFALLVP